MADYNFFTKDEMERAQKNNNALQYALSRGYNLVPVGNEFHLKEHSSMVFTRNGGWFWNSQGLKGDAIDFIQHYEGKSFAEAVKILAGTAPGVTAPQRPSANVIPFVPAVFVLPERTENFKNMFAYLIRTRGIDPQLVKDLTANHQLMQVKTFAGMRICGYDISGKGLYAPNNPDNPKFSSFPFQEREIVSLDGTTPMEKKKTERCITSQEADKLAYENVLKRHNNLAMLGYGPDGKVRYCSLRSMNSTGNSFKIDAPGSSKETPFLIRGVKDADTVIVTESPIEAMSYKSLCAITSSPRQNADILSLGGANIPKGLDGFLSRNPQIKNIVLGLNRDDDGNHKIRAGELGTEKLMQKYGQTYQVSVHKPALNDWNDVLRRIRELRGMDTQEHERSRNRSAQTR